MKKIPPIKLQLIIFLSCYAAYLAVKDKDVRFIIMSIVAAAAAAGAEAAFTFLKDRKFALSQSAVISGLIIGYVIASDNPWWVFVFAGLAAICSKRIIRASGRHIFNPAAFGILLNTLLFAAYTQWKGTYGWYILIPAGLYFTYKIRKLEVLAGYAVSSLVLFGAQALIQRVPLADIFGYFSYFFICIMLIEPQTSPLKRRGKLIFGAGVGILVFILTGAGAKFDVELGSLLALNLAVPLLNKLTA